MSFLVDVLKAIFGEASVSVSVPLCSGYDAAADNVAALKAACDRVIANPLLQPVKNAAGKIVETHCNEGAEEVAEVMGCHELAGLMADGQYQRMDDNLSGRWAKVGGEAAALHAQKGGLAFAALPSSRLGELNGHIATIYPAPMELSGSLGREVPMVANVGTCDREERASEAFPVADGEPDYFTWS